MKSSNFNMSGNVTPLIEKPLDQRKTVLNSVKFLWDNNYWEGVYMYPGMIVPVINENTNDLYMFIKQEPVKGCKLLSQKIEKTDWVKINGGGLGLIDGGTAESVYITRKSFPKGPEGEEAYKAANFRGEVQVIDGGKADNFE